MRSTNYQRKGLSVGIFCMLAFCSHVAIADSPPPTSQPVTLINYVKSVTFSPDGRLVAAGYADGTLKVWDVKAELYWTRPSLLAIKAHDETRDVAFSPDGSRIATVGRDENYVESRAGDNPSGTVENTKLWVVGNGGLIWEKVNQRMTAGARYTVAFSPDGKLIASAGGTYGRGDIQILNVETGGFERRLNPQTGPVESFVFSPDGSSIISAAVIKQENDFSYGVTNWDTNTANLKQSWVTNRDFITSLAISADGKIVVIGNSEAVETGKVVKGTSQAEWRSKVLAREIQTGKVLALFSPQDAVPYGEGRYLYVGDIKFSPDGKNIAYLIQARSLTSAKSRIEIKDFAGRKLLKTISDPNAAIQTFAFSPDGKQIVTGDNYGLVKLWSIH